MTTAEARDDLLGLLSVEAANADAATLSRILSDQNALLQTIWTMLPQGWSQVPTGERLAAPAALTGLTLSQGAKTISGTLTAEMVGCTIRLDGDTNDNILATTTTLARPYLGASTGAGTGTIFGDCITLGTGTVGVLGPVILLGEHELTPLRSRRDLQMFSTAQVHYQTRNDMPEQEYSVADPRDVNRPIGFLVEQELIGTRVQLRLRVSPLPDREYVVQFDKRIATPRVMALDSTEIPLPQDMAESIYLPMLRQRFSTWKHFPAEAKAGLKEMSDDAFTLLVKMKPMPVRLGRARVRPEDW